MIRQYCIKFSTPTTLTAIPVGSNNPTSHIINGKEEGYVWEIFGRRLNVHGLNEAYSQVDFLMGQKLYVNITFTVEEYDLNRNYLAS